MCKMYSDDTKIRPEPASEDIKVVQNDIETIIMTHETQYSKMQRHAHPQDNSLLGLLRNSQVI